MQSRNSIQNLIRETGEKVERFRTWAKAGESEAMGLLCEKLPSGFANWFAVEKGKTIWWIYSDASDGGSWSVEGVTIVGFRIEYDKQIAQRIYDLVYKNILGKTKFVMG
ncbi:hypothetical protein G7025_10325 [Pseudomonas lurida]|uniref:hypothetical protein n=1 Tax=Pseudomonas lurida TaxID=244566 RepID=UPI0015E42F35|nr:hypothetical protein [Pseudomonas lurida]MBA1293754.1 hypothetical protein [Pseudomonas lurida]